MNEGAQVKRGQLAMKEVDECVAEAEITECPRVNRVLEDHDGGMISESHKKGGEECVK